MVETHLRNKSVVEDYRQSLNLNYAVESSWTENISKRSYLPALRPSKTQSFDRRSSELESSLKLPLLSQPLSVGPLKLSGIPNRFKLQLKLLDRRKPVIFDGIDIKRRLGLLKKQSRYELSDDDSSK